jgi:hypothetical protein
VLWQSVADVEAIAYRTVYKNGQVPNLHWIDEATQGFLNLPADEQRPENPNPGIPSSL